MAKSPRWVPKAQLPEWIPAPRAWVNAVALIMLMIAWQYAIAYLYENVGLRMNSMIHLPWKVWCVLILLGLLSPILLVAFLHHWLHRLLDNFFPESKLPETQTVPETFPGVMSWWQGLYGWLVDILSTVIAFTLVVLFLPDNSMYYFLKLFSTEAIHWYTIPIIIKVVIAACFYQFEYVLHQRLIAAAVKR
jgi:hypothetical protein